MLCDQVEEEGHVKNIFSIGDSNQVDYLPNAPYWYKLKLN